MGGIDRILLNGKRFTFTKIRKAYLNPQKGKPLVATALSSQSP